MTSTLASAIDIAARHQIAAPAASGASGSVPISVMLIIVLGMWAHRMHKHGQGKHQLHLMPGFVCLSLGLCLSGTLIGSMIGNFLGQIGNMLASFVGHA